MSNRIKFIHKPVSDEHFPYSWSDDVTGKRGRCDPARMRYRIDGEQCYRSFEHVLWTKKIADEDLAGELARFMAAELDRKYAVSEEGL